MCRGVSEWFEQEKPHPGLFCKQVLLADPMHCRTEAAQQQAMASMPAMQGMVRHHELNQPYVLTDCVSLRPVRTEALFIQTQVSGDADDAPAARPAPKAVSPHQLFVILVWQ